MQSALPLLFRLQRPKYHWLVCFVNIQKATASSFNRRFILFHFLHLKYPLVNGYREIRVSRLLFDQQLHKVTTSNMNSIKYGYFDIDTTLCRSRITKSTITTYFRPEPGWRGFACIARAFVEARFTSLPHKKSETPLSAPRSALSCRSLLCSCDLIFSAWVKLTRFQHCWWGKRATMILVCTKWCYLLVRLLCLITL